jgi:hypothetical protein
MRSADFGMMTMAADHHAGSPRIRVFNPQSKIRIPHYDV